jgi:hypothetical protein
MSSTLRSCECLPCCAVRFWFLFSPFLGGSGVFGTNTILDALKEIHNTTTTTTTGTTNRQISRSHAGRYSTSCHFIAFTTPSFSPLGQLCFPFSCLKSLLFCRGFANPHPPPGTATHCGHKLMFTIRWSRTVSPSPKPSSNHHH